MIRSLVSCALFVGLGTGAVVSVLLALLPAVRIAGTTPATARPMAVRAVLVEGLPGGPAVLAAPEAWRRCPHLAATAARSRCPFLAALAAGSSCPYLNGRAAATGDTEAPLPRPHGQRQSAPHASRPKTDGMPEGTTLVRLDPTQRARSAADLG